MAHWPSQFAHWRWLVPLPSAHALLSYWLAAHWLRHVLQPRTARLLARARRVRALLVGVAVPVGDHDAVVSGEA